MVRRTLVWHDYPDEKPVSGKWLDNKNYLVEVKYNISDGSYYDVLEYADGWNCFVESDGKINREHEMVGIIAWAEIPPMRRPKKKEDK